MYLLKRNEKRSGIAHLTPKVKTGSFLLSALALRKQHIIVLKDLLLSCRLSLIAVLPGTD